MDIEATVRKHMEDEDEWRPMIEKKLDEHHRILVGTDDEPGIAPVVREMHSILKGSRFTLRAFIGLCAIIAGATATFDWVVKHLTIK